MVLKYHYSVFADLLFLAMGVAFLVVGTDLLFYHKLVRLADPPPTYVSAIILFFGVLLSSGFLINLINLVRGKRFVIEADSSGLTVHTNDLSGKFPKVFIEWKHVLKIETRRINSTFGQNSKGRATSAIVIKVAPRSIKWPSVMIARNRISFRNHDEYSELTIDAWLNKRKDTIVNEINKLRKDLGVA